MSGDILQTPDAPKPQGALDNYFKITARGSTVRQEVLAGLTTFLAMVYSVIVVPGMLGKAGFPPAACCHLSGRGLRLVADGVVGQFANGDWLRDFLDGVYRIQSGTRATN